MPAQTLWFLDTLTEIHLDAEDTGGDYSMLTCTAPPGHMPPPHIHAVEDEGFVVLEGQLTVHTTAGSVALGVGDAAHAPHGEPHTIEVTSATPARWLVVSRPAGFEEFVRAMSTPALRPGLPTLDGPPDVDRLVAIAGEHGITFVGPPGTRPAELAAPSSV